MKDSLEWLLDPEDGLVAAPPVSTELETLHGNLLNQLGNLQHLLNSNHKVSEELRALRLAYREDSALGLNIAEALATNSVSWSDRPYIAVCEHKNGEVSFECPTETYCHAIVECNMCTGLTRWKDYIYAPCGHALCRSCIIHYFGLVTRHESAYPPRCCLEPVPLYKVHDWLGAELIELYLEKQLEYDTMDRTYCANKNCLAFIPSHSGRDNKFANCLKCERKTCAWCKSLEHGDEECKLDEGEQALMNLSKDTGWKKCWRCGHWWEKDGGCDHMTCLKCGAEFCYVCGDKYNGCRCVGGMYDGAERVDDFEEDFPEDYPENEDHRELGTDIEQGLAQIGENEGYRGWGGWADYLDRPENFVALNGVNGAQRQDRIGRRGRGGDGRGGREGHDLGHRPAGTVDYGDDQGWVDAGGPHAMPEEWGEDMIRFWATLEARRAETYSWIPEEVRPAEIARREQECRHERSQWQRVPGAARCRACEWRADVFYMWCRGCYLIACRDCHSRPELFRERFGPPDHSEDIEVEGSELEEATYNEFSRMSDSGSDHEDDIADPWSLPASEESPDYSESELGDSQPQPGINTGRGDEIGSCLRTAEQIQLFRSEVLQEAERRLAGALQRFQAAADNFWDVHVRYPGMQDADVEEGEIYEARVWWLEAARKLTDAQQDMRRLDGNECARVRI